MLLVPSRRMSYGCLLGYTKPPEKEKYLWKESDRSKSLCGMFNWNELDLSGSTNEYFSSVVMRQGYGEGIRWLSQVSISMIVLSATSQNANDCHSMSKYMSARIR